MLNGKEAAMRLNTFPVPTSHKAWNVCLLNRNLVARGLGNSKPVPQQTQPLFCSHLQKGESFLHSKLPRSFVGKWNMKISLIMLKYFREVIWLWKFNYLKPWEDREWGQWQRERKEEMNFFPGQRDVTIYEPARELELKYLDRKKKML